MPQTSTGSSRLSSRQSGSKGPVPTAAHLERKRQTDRESQRVVRERTKNYISHLEKLVDTLQKSQQDERLQSMALQCTQLQEENQRLRNVIASITRITRSVEMPNPVKRGFTRLLPSASGDSVTDLRHPPQSIVEINGFTPTVPLQSDKILQQIPLLLDEHNMSSGASCTDSTGLNMHSPVQGTEITAVGFPANSGSSPALESSENRKASPVSGHEPSQVFDAINNLLSTAENLSISTLQPDQDADITIRAVAHGWSAVEGCYDLDPSWQIIRQIHQDIFFCCGRVEQLAVIRVVRSKLLDQITKANQQPNQTLVPAYMHSRPLQSCITHPSVIDYFVWPELREFLVLKEDPGPTNHIAAAFASNLRFLWPYDLSDIWTRNRQTGLYSFSKLFDERFEDIGSWALNKDFFDMYPQLMGYIPSCDVA